jgi:hypothetical protein
VIHYRDKDITLDVILCLKRTSYTCDVSESVLVCVIIWIQRNTFIILLLLDGVMLSSIDDSMDSVL